MTALRLTGGPPVPSTHVPRPVVYRTERVQVGRRLWWAGVPQACAECRGRLVEDDDRVVCVLCSREPYEVQERRPSPLPKFDVKPGPVGNPTLGEGEKGGLVSVTAIHEWRWPGCGDECRPRQHAPAAHEAYGARGERMRLMQAVVRTGPLVIDRAARQVWVDGAAVVLSPVQWRMLDALAATPGVAVPYSDLAAAVFGGGWDADGTKPVINNLNTHRSRLRQKLGVAASRVVTVPAYGMRLEVEP